MLKRIIIETKLKAANTCPVLTDYILQMHDGCAGIVDDQNAIDLLNTLMGCILNNMNFEFFDKIESTICDKFKINSDERNIVFNQLDLAGKLYITYSFMGISTSYISEEFDKFIAISSAAKRLQDLLPAKESPLFGLVELMNFAETHDGENKDAEIFFGTLNQSLNKLIDFKKQLPNTKMGESLKIGVKTPKGNANVRAWVELLHLLWTVELRRTYDYDGENGKNGRKRFTDFSYDCLQPIHPAIEYRTLKNAIRRHADKLKAGNELLDRNIIDKKLIA